MNRLLKIALLFTLLITGAIVTRAQTIIVPPSLGVMTSTQTSRNTATLSGNLLRTGGENPTVKIVWGTQDRGLKPIPDFSWDNEVTISTNQSSGTFSTNITIPAQGNVYYFRAIASNAAGTVVSRNLGVLLPTKIVGSENLVGRWSFNNGDSNDSSGNGYHGNMINYFTPISVSGMKLWVDASDTSTISTVNGSNDVETWTNKIGETVKLYGHTTNKPSTGSSINGLNAIEFDKRSDNNMEHFTAKKNNSTDWNPAGTDGTVSGKVQDVALLMIARLDTARRSGFPFGMGWGDHFPWTGGIIWKYSDASSYAAIGSNGTVMLITMRYSKLIKNRKSSLTEHLFSTIHAPMITELVIWQHSHFPT